MAYWYDDERAMEMSISLVIYFGLTMGGVVRMPKQKGTSKKGRGVRKGMMVLPSGVDKYVHRLPLCKGYRMGLVLSNVENWINGCAIRLKCHRLHKCYIGHSSDEICLWVG